MTTCTQPSDHLIAEHKSLAVFLANRVWLAARKRPERDCMVSDAFLGLFRAAQRYNPSLGSFGAYAAKAINGAVIDGLPRAQRIKLPAYLHHHMTESEVSEALQQETEDLQDHAIMILKEVG
jgi:RNA polymerase sigma factor (sigma-70 family)